MHRWFLISSLPCSREKINLKFLLPSLKTLTNFKNCSESRIKFRLSFDLIGRFSLGYIHGQLSNHFSGSQGGFWKEGFSQFVPDFKEASRNFILDFLHKKTANKFNKYTVSSFKNFQKIFIS
jgi:hypothetical protein